MHARCLSILEQTPEILGHLLRGLTPSELIWQPSKDRWSIRMVLAHLADVEINGFRQRFQAISRYDDPFLPSYDPEALFRSANNFDAHHELVVFRDRRHDTLKFLRTVTKNSEVYNRTGRHEEFGEISFVQLLNEFAFHDLGHIRQIMELYRSCGFYPHMGAFQSIYKINP